MKKTFLTISVIINVILIIIIIWCCFPCKPHPDKSTCTELKKRNLKTRNVMSSSDSPGAPGTYCYVSACDSTGRVECENCYPPVCCDAPLHCVTACFAKMLVKQYRDNHWTNSNSVVFPEGGTEGKIDSRAVWFSLKRLKRFIYEIEHKTCNLSAANTCGVPHMPELGIRIYFGEYPAATEWNNYPELRNWPQYADEGTTTPAADEYANMHTLVLVPTYFNGSMNVDFSPSTGCGFNCGDSSILVPELANHGDMIPPPWDCTQYWSLGATFLGFVDDDRSNYSGGPTANPVTIGLQTGKVCPN